MLRWLVHLEGGRKRTGHAAVAVGHKVYSFGGYCYGETYMYNMVDQFDVHVFNTVSLRWMKLPLVTTGREHHSFEVPSMRRGHTAVLIEDIVYIWGGFNGVRELYNVLYAFHVDTHRWVKPNVSGTVPESRFGHSACDLGKLMYVFGGYKWLTQWTNDIYKLDTTTMVWTLINTRGTPAPASSQQSATIIGTKMFVFGGTADQINHNTISVFDTEINCWLNMPSAQLLPEGRAGHSAFDYSGKLYIFGGFNFLLNRSFNDLWEFDPETSSWKKIEPKGKSTCWMSSMCCCMVGDRVIFFGGYRYTPIPVDFEDLEDDTKVSHLYILDLSPSLKTLCKLAVIHYSLEQSCLPHDIRWELAAMTTNSNRINIDDNGREQDPGN